MSPFLGEQLVDGRAAELVFARTDQPARFVQRQINFALGLYRLPINGDMIVARLNFSAELLHNLAINPNSPLQNELFACPSRSHPCVCEVFLQANHLSEE